MAAFRNLCGDASEARNCEALAPYYQIFFLSSDPERNQWQNGEKLPKEKSAFHPAASRV
jgi:hypothetical protein